MVVLKEQAPAGKMRCACIEDAVGAIEHAARGFEMDARYALSRLMLQVLDASGEDAAGERPRAGALRVNEMCRFVERHLGEDIGVADMVHAAGSLPDPARTGR